MEGIPAGGGAVAVSQEPERRNGLIDPRSTARGQRLIPRSGLLACLSGPATAAKNEYEEPHDPITVPDRPGSRDLGSSVGGYNSPSLPPQAMACRLVVTPSLR